MRVLITFLRVSTRGLWLGGVHEKMGTYNRVLKLGQGCYLEIIAINPKAQKPERPRWVELDRHAMQESGCHFVELQDCHTHLESIMHILGSVGAGHLMKRRAPGSLFLPT
jgi:hypothetical protein